MIIVSRNKCGPDFFAALFANGDRLQVGIVGLHPARRGPSLQVMSMKFAGRRMNVGWQLIDINRFQFDGVSIIQHVGDGRLDI